MAYVVLDICAWLMSKCIHTSKIYICGIFSKVQITRQLIPAYVIDFVELHNIATYTCIIISPSPTNAHS